MLICVRSRRIFSLGTKLSFRIKRNLPEEVCMCMSTDTEGEKVGSVFMEREEHGTSLEAKLIITGEKK